MSRSVRLKMWSRKQSLLTSVCHFTCAVVISLLVFAEFSERVSAEYTGCYKENQYGPRLMKGYHQDFPIILTTEKCISVCTANGFAYAGLQNGFECYCDSHNPPPSAAANEGECSAKCPGNKNEYCGGGWRLSVFKTGLSGADTINTYIGCYKENENGSRLLKGFQKNYPDSLTVQKCINLCYSKGFRYAGVQYKLECFCDNVKPPLTRHAEEEDCSQKCSGDSSQICGGGWRISVYETGIEGPPSEAIENYVGCFKDQLAPRLLGGHLQDFPNNLTPERCVGLCYRMGFLYAGLQHSTQCFCGDRHPSPLDQAPENECQKSCSGDGNKICGGNWRLSIYETTITDIPEAGKLIGCFIDARNNRVMKEHKIDLVKTNSPRRCLNLCLQLGYHYAGVEYGWECFCSNTRPNEVGIVSDDNCKIPCPGDPGQICGGGWRIYAYRTGIDTENKDKHCLLETPSQALTTPETPAPTLATPVPTLATPAANIATPVPTTENSHLLKPEITIPMELGEPDELTLNGNSVTTFNGRKTYQGKVIFEEHFNDASNFQSNWQHDVRVADKPDYEFCVYTDSSANSYIYNGTLILKPTVLPNKFVRTGNIKITNCTGRPNTVECEFQAKSYHLLPPVLCARLNTLQSFTFRYGVVEIIAKLPYGDWLVPELWLEPKAKAYGPDYRSGRIRLAVTRGNSDLKINSEDIGYRKLESGVLMGTDQDNVRGRTITRETGPNGWYKDFHNYTVVWTPDNVSFLVDGQQQYSLVPSRGSRLSDIIGFSQHESETWAEGTSLAPFDKEFYISLGLSAGGVRDFPDNCINRGNPKPWKNLELKSTLNFWLDRNNWLPTWNNETAALHIRSVKVTAI